MTVTGPLKPAAFEIDRQIVINARRGRPEIVFVALENETDGFLIECYNDATGRFQPYRSIIGLWRLTTPPAHQVIKFQPSIYTPQGITTAVNRCIVTIT